MAYFVGLDVSVKETSICIVDDAGKIVKEAKVASEPEALVCFFKELGVPVGSSSPRCGGGPGWCSALLRLFYCG